MNKSILSRRESIILTAVSIIDELGLQAVSTREIARRENITDAALYKHFKNKEEIILAVLDYYSRFDELIIKSVQLNKYKSKDAILYSINLWAEYYQNDPASAAIMNLYETLEHDELLGTKIKGILDTRYDHIRSLIIRGQETGEIKESIPSEYLADTIVGQFRFIVLKWRLQNFQFSIKKRAVEAAQSLIDLV